ncbi:hypothetical protein CKM354_000994300 [Cercospora kikuchii]|uniref:Methyltransferase type 11 domain-containing protein n=1 Tax=Cercospora kikuchii TaxID=84275 RepID=A0A9P3CQ05_9PEZI|nr:uncharacterized protein CKM354_000994300 [Cercospora kikuchii]GIZ46834.1 hypothetical protein CKM354_000994300 [Cercospora kikuchii]
MSVVDREVGALARSEYWDAIYAKSDGKSTTHEWLRSYNDLQPFPEKHLFAPFQPAQDPKILHLGAGDSTVPRDLLALGYQNQICVDFSRVLVDTMAARKEQCQSVDVAFDKSTLDAMVYGSAWEPPEEVKKNASRYMREVARVLKDRGIFLSITYQQPHFVKPLLSQDSLWNMEVEVLKPSESSLEYYAWVLRKA